jgi:hypothetical protein
LKGIEDKSLQRYLNATWISESNKDLEKSTFREHEKEIKSGSPPKGGAADDPQIAKIN